MTRTLSALVLGLIALGCAPSASTIFDQWGRQVTIVDTGIDAAGGMRLTTIGQFNGKGEYNVLSAASGPGTFQTVLPSVLSGGAFIAGMSVLRPAEFNNQTSVNATNSGISASSDPAVRVRASGEAGGSSITGGSAPTTGGTVSGAVSATGGSATGGPGGQGGAGGNSTSMANPTSTANPTLSNINQPSMNSSNTSSPMFAPQFSPVISTTGGVATGGAGGSAVTGSSSATGGAGGASTATTGASTATGGAANATGGTGSCQGNCQ